MDFKKFVQDKIEYLAAHFHRKAVLLEENGEALFEINLSFDALTDEYLSKAAEMESSAVQM